MLTKFKTECTCAACTYAVIESTLFMNVMKNAKLYHATALSNFNTVSRYNVHVHVDVHAAGIAIKALESTCTFLKGMAQYVKNYIW